MFKYFGRTYASLRPVLEFLTFAAAGIEVVRYCGEYLAAGIAGIQSFSPTTQTALIVHTAVILILVLFVGEVPRLQKRAEYDEAVTASRQFAILWALLWITLLVFYGMRTWAEFGRVTDNHTVHIVLDSVAVIATAFLLLCYLVLTMPSVPLQQFELLRLIIWFLIFGGAFIAAEAIITSSNPALENFFDGAQGLVAGIVTALFVGRLESRLISSPRWIVIAAYGYAVLQLAYPVLETTGPDNQLARLAFLSLALIIKVLLFWHVRSLIVSGRMTYYMVEYRRLTAVTPDAWVQFRNDFLPQGNA